MSSVFIGKEYPFMCDASVCGERVRGRVLFVGFLAVVAHGWRVVAFGCAVRCLPLGDARPLLLQASVSACSTYVLQRLHLLVHEHLPAQVI